MAFSSLPRSPRKSDEQIGEGVDARFVVSFHEHKLADIHAIGNNDRSDERDFAAVDRFSELGTELYEIGLRPLVQSWVTPQVADFMRRAHPGRVSRAMFGDANPFMKGVPGAAAKAAEERKPVDANNPFLFAEKLWATAVINAFDVFRDWRDAAYEAAFLGIYGSPVMIRFAPHKKRS